MISGPLTECFLVEWSFFFDLFWQGLERNCIFPGCVARQIKNKDSWFCCACSVNKQIAQTISLCAGWIVAVAKCLKVTFLFYFFFKNWVICMLITFITVFIFLHPCWQGVLLASAKPLSKIAFLRCLLTKQTNFVTSLCWSVVCFIVSHNVWLICYSCITPLGYIYQCFSNHKPS